VVEPLLPADRSSLAAERGSVNMAILGVIVLEPGAQVDADSICARLTERLHLLPRYRQRLEQPALGIAHPVWVDDEHFDVRWHVRQTTLSPPGADEQLSAYVAGEAGRLMDRTRPLWELHIVHGLQGGRVAVIPKMHHALLDGMAAVGVGMILLDPGPEPLPVEPPDAEWAPTPYGMRRHLLKFAGARMAHAQRLALETSARLLDTSARDFAGDLKRAADLTSELAGGRSSASPLPFNASISPNRAYAMTRAPLAPIKAAGKANGGTVNDALLAAVSGMLAGYLGEAGVDVAALRADPVALVPVSIRREGDTAATGNRISIVMIDLPVREPDPRARIAALAERMRAIKGSAKIAAGALMVDMTGLAPPLLASVLTRAPGLGTAFNLVVSNVPGPQQPLYLNGARVEAIHPVVPLNPGDQGLNVGVFSYDGTVCFGLAADRALDPPVRAAVAALRAALDEVAALA
jgi:diacylglycerol O-acyltransferase